MKNSLKRGLSFSIEKKFTEDQLASTLNVGDVPFVSTPSLLILMEQTCNSLLSGNLDSNETSISAEINIKHTKPVASNQEVKCAVHLKFVDDEKLFFDFVLTDKHKDVIAIGAHERIIINKNSFSHSFID